MWVLPMESEQETVENREAKVDPQFIHNPGLWTLWKTPAYRYRNDSRRLLIRVLKAESFLR